MNIPLFDGHCDTLHKLMSTSESAPDRQRRPVEPRPLPAVRTTSANFCCLCRLRPAGCARTGGVADSADAPGVAAWHPTALPCRTTGTQAKEAVAAGKAGGVSVGGGGGAAGLLAGNGCRRCTGTGCADRSTLTWNHANALAGSHCDQPERGAEPAGQEVRVRAW